MNKSQSPPDQDLKIGDHDQQAPTKVWLGTSKNKIVAIHYACSDVARTPGEISCIVVKEFVTKKTMAFSRADDISEKELLSRFYAYIQRDFERIYVGWNMKNTTFGFPALERRYKKLFKEEPPKPRYIVDLDEVIKKEYGRAYVNHGPHGKLFNLMRLNGITILCFRPGKEEAELYDDKKFFEIERSTNCKVHGIAEILDLYLRSELKTQAGVPMIIKRKLDVIINKIYESPLVKIILIIAAILTIMLFLIYFWG